MGVSLILVIYVNYDLLKLSHQLRSLGHVNHFQQPFYIVNPTFRKHFQDHTPLSWNIWLNRIFQFILVFLCSILISTNLLPNNLQINLLCELGMGFILGRYIQSILSLIGNVSLFRFIIQHPKELSGEVVLSKSVLLMNSKLELLVNFICWFLIFIIVERVFFLGGCLASVFGIVRTFQWEKDSLEEKQISV